MRRTFALVAAALASIAAAAMASLLRPTPPRPVPPQQQGDLRVSAQLDRRYFSETSGGEAYLQVDLSAAGGQGERARVPVNAVLILDRSGSMSGEKIEKAREAARALIAALNGEDRLALIAFSSDAQVLLPSTAMTPGAREQALAAVNALDPTGGTNLESALRAAGPELQKGHAQGRADKVFLASDGQVNEGVTDRTALLAETQRDLGSATVSTFGIGDDYDENLLSALAAQAGGRARYIQSAAVLPEAFHAELTRASRLVARGVRLKLRGLAGAEIGKVLGYDVQDGFIRLPDFAAGEERRVLARVNIPAGHGQTDLALVEVVYDDGKTVQATASASFTRDGGKLAEAPGPAALEGARLEMAEAAESAARLREEGRREEAKAQLANLYSIANRAAAAAPAQAAAMHSKADEYRDDVQAIEGAGSAAGKRLKEKAFDAARAPVAGW